MQSVFYRDEMAREILCRRCVYVIYGSLRGSAAALHAELRVPEGVANNSIAYLSEGPGVVTPDVLSGILLDLSPFTALS